MQMRKAGNKSRDWQEKVLRKYFSFPLEVNCLIAGICFNSFLACGNFYRLLIIYANSLDPDGLML